MYVSVVQLYVCVCTITYYGIPQALRDNCWKARDDSARLQKESEAKLKQVYRETEVSHSTNTTHTYLFYTQTLCVHTYICTLHSSLVPRPSAGGGKAWYTLFAHAPKLPTFR